MKSVLDTNVLIAGLLSPYGPPAQVLQLVLSRKTRLCLDARILLEYRQVLARPSFGFDQQSVADVIDFFEDSGDLVAATPWGAALPDPDDAVFLEVAYAGGAQNLVTGNSRHFPVRARRGVSVVTPAEFLSLPQVRGLDR